MTVHEMLVQARALVAAGWWQRDPVPGCYCLATALMEIYESDPALRMKTLDQAIAALVVATAVAPGRGCESSLIAWNDAEGRTRADVLAAFDRAIEATP